MVANTAHEQVILRLWDTFYRSWSPITGVRDLKVTHHSDLGVDTMVLNLVSPNPLDQALLNARVIGPPVSFELNGVIWTGRVSQAKKTHKDGVESWEVTVASDDKHFHRLLSKTPVTAANAAQVAKKGTFSDVAEWMISRGVQRTGLPTYILAETTGPEVEVTARTEDTVADVLSPVAERADVFINVTTLTPDFVHTYGLPGNGPIKQMMGVMERRWFTQFMGEGAWPFAEPLDRISPAPTYGDDVVNPDGWFVGKTSIDHLGRVREFTPDSGVCWNPFDTALAKSPTSIFYDDGSSRAVAGVTRCATSAELAQLASSDDRRWFGVFVTQWAAGAWAEGNDLGKLVDCARAGLLVRGDGVQVREEDIPALNAYIGSGAAWAWVQGGQWVVANRVDWERETRARMVTGPQKPTPGVLMHIMGERDRRNIVFSTAPGGGLDGWDATINPPEAAALVAGAQWDQWMSSLLTQGGLSERAVKGVQVSEPAAVAASSGSQLPGVGKAVAAAGGAVERVTAKVAPLSTAEGTDVSFSTLTAGMDMSIVGPLFYREKYFGIGSGEWSGDTAATFEDEWAGMQGSTAMALNVTTTNSTVFGMDVQREDGAWIPGWMEGDRVTFIDGDVRITEVITGWECSISADKPYPVVTPILGKRADSLTPVDSLVDTVRRIQKATEKTQISPARVPAKSDVATVADEIVEPVRVVAEEAKAAASVAVTSVTRFWRWADTNPGTPTGTDNPSGWSTTQPAYVVGQKLWTTTRTIFSNGTASWAPTTEEASVAAATAISTAAANDKNRIWYAATAPGSTQGSRPGDTWFQYSGSTIVGQWKWSGSAWDSQQIGDQVIANLDAGKITAGYLDAQRIAASSIKAEHLEAGSITASKVNADEIFLKATGDISLQQQWDDFGVQLDIAQASIGFLSRLATRADSTRRGFGLLLTTEVLGSTETKSLFTADNRNIYATGSWKGRFIAISLGNPPNSEYVELSGTGNRSAGASNGGSIILWERDPVIESTTTIKPIETWDAPQNAWTTIPGMSTTLAAGAASVSVDGKVFFTNVNRGSTYGVRVLVGGNVVWSWQSTTFGPLTFLGNPTWSAPVRFECDGSGGKILLVQALCDNATASKRRVTTATQVSVTSYIQA